MNSVENYATTASLSPSPSPESSGAQLDCAATDGGLVFEETARKTGRGADSGFA
jgi:hypothetical protein